MRDPRDNYLSFKNAKWVKNTPKKKLKDWTNSEKWAVKWVNTYLEVLRYFLTNSEHFYLQTHESLIYSFDQELSNLSNFLDISKEGVNLDIINKPEQLAYSSSGQNIRGLDTRSIERWKMELDKNDVKIIEDIGGVLMKLLGYQNTSSENSNCLWGLKRNFKACVKKILHKRLNFYH